MFAQHSNIAKVLFWLAIIVAYMAAVLPQDLAPTIPQVGDKVHHVFAFVVLGVLLRLAYNINYWYGLLALIGFGAFIELSQYYTPSRMAEYRDILADTIGALIGLKIYLKKTI